MQALLAGDDRHRQHITFAADRTHKTARITGTAEAGGQIATGAEMRLAVLSTRA
ncbi:hypothetical protein VWX97_17250 [Phaeobacter sp. JH18-32]|uniref:hypothetical protein n=1 Tax=Phaeobacter TaxID=302485 RepID=UPI003A85455B